MLSIDQDSNTWCGGVATGTAFLPPPDVRGGRGGQESGDERANFAIGVSAMKTDDPCK